MAKKKTAAELAKSQGISRRYLFYKKRVKENPLLYLAFRSKKLPLHIAAQLTDADIPQQDYVLAATSSKEARARFKEIKAKLYEQAKGETLAYRRLREAWGKCSQKDQEKFLLNLEHLYPPQEQDP
jgi:hypothetical protein